MLSSLLSLLLLPLAAVAAVDPNELSGHLSQGAPILGTFNPSTDPLTEWMKNVPDNITLSQLNVVGTHDAAAWNYSGLEAEWVLCQDQPLFSQLDGGIRLFDLRFGWDASHTTLVFYHAEALLDPTAQLNDIFWGFYHWLDTHPSEVLFVSLKVDNGVTDAQLQTTVYGLLTSSPGSDYWLQQDSTLPDLGSTRGKIILLRRFDWGTVPTNIGLNLSSGWADNNPEFSIPYTASNSAFIEDYYQIEGDTATVTKVKLNATISHVEAAVAAGSDELWISFASGAGELNTTVTPKVLAVGDGTVTGVNANLTSFFPTQKCKRTGLVLLDFFASSPDLVTSIIGYDGFCGTIVTPPTSLSSSSTTGTATPPPSDTKSSSTPASSSTSSTGGSSSSFRLYPMFVFPLPFAMLPFLF